MQKKKAKWLSDALQIAVKRRETKSKGEKERYTHLNAEFQRIVRRDKKAFLSNQWKEIEKKIIEWERLEISSIWHEMAFKRWEEYTEELYKKKIFMTQIITIE